MRGTLAGSAARVAGGIGIVACAAVVAFSVGGGGLFGGLGGLFGRTGSSLEVAEAGSPAADIVAAPTAAERAAALRNAFGRDLRTRPRSPERRSHRQGTGPPRSAPAPSPGPLAPAPSLPSPPVTPAPSPGGGQAAGTVRDTAGQVTGQAPPQLQPVTQPVNEALDQVVQTCRGLPVCP